MIDVGGRNRGARLSATKGPFIATQLFSTRRRVELCRYKRALSQPCTNRVDVCCTSDEFCMHATTNVSRARPNIVREAKHCIIQLYSSMLVKYTAIRLEYKNDFCCFKVLMC